MNFINEMIQDIKEEFNNDSQHTTEKFNNNNLHTNQTTEHWRRSRNNRHRIKLTLTNYISIILFGPFGQLYVRATKAKGSLDKIWLFAPLFWLPPLSLIPAYYLGRGKLKSGNDKNPMSGLSALWPTLAAFMSPFIMKSLEMGELGEAMIPLIVYATSVITYFIRNKKRCSKGTLSRASYSSSMVLIIATMFTFTFKYVLANIDMLGDLLSTIYESPFLENTVYAAFVYTSYCAVNMYNNSPSLRKYCKKIKTHHLIYSLFSTILISAINPMILDHDE